MNLEKYLNYNRLGEVLTISNTINFLYKRFIGEPGILSLYSDFETKELIEKFVDVYKGEKKFHQIIDMYSVIFALSFKADTYADEFFNTLERLDDIKWNKEIVEIFMNKQKVTFVNSSLVLNYQYSSNALPNGKVEVKEYSIQ